MVLENSVLKDALYEEISTALTYMDVNQAKSQFEIQRMQTEAEIKRQLMAEEFNYQLQLEQMKNQRESQKEQMIEDRKDKRTRIAGTQQSQMIDQRQNDLMPIDFEAQGEQPPVM